MRSQVGIAVLGAGFIAEYHLAGLAHCPQADVRVLVSRSVDRAASVAARFGVPEVSDDWQHTLTRTDIDAVIICTPDDTHESFAVSAAQSGKAILLQKPMAGSVQACCRIAEQASRSRVDLQVSFMHRWFPEFQQAQAWLQEGLIGRIHSVHLRNATPGPDWGDWFFSATNVSGGVVDQLGVHGIDLLLQLFGDIQAVSARLCTQVPSRTLRDGRTVAVENPDTAFAVYDLASGAIAAHEMSQVEVQGCDRFRLELYGDRGTLLLRTHRGLIAAWAPHRFGERWMVPELSSVPFGAQQHQAWLDGVTGRTPRLPSAKDAIRGMQVVEAIRKSAQKNGASVQVEKRVH